MKLIILTQDHGGLTKLFNKKKKRFVVLDINEYVIRAIVMSTSNVSEGEVFESSIPPRIIDGDVIKDEMALFELLKELIQKWGIKKADVRFFVPDSSIMMKTFEHPGDMESSRLKGYVEMELGRTIHLPFTQPLIDVYDDTPNDGEATLFAAPSEEVTKMAGILDDLSLHPTHADIKALSTIRFLDKSKSFVTGKIYLITDWSINGINISIYTPGKLEFLRYQSIETSILDWKPSEQTEQNLEFYFEGDLEEYRAQLIDQIAEIDRILNFYRFSLYKGEKEVNEIIILGDSPEMDYIVSQMRVNYDTPIRFVDDSNVQAIYPNLKAKYISLIGLVHKEAL